MLASPPAHLPRLDNRGVTLMELMVSTALITLVLASVMAAFLANNRLYRNLSDRHSASEGARLASSVIERYLGSAGYGVTPEFFFGPCTTATPCLRDNVVGGGAADGNPGTDELVYFQRNLRYFSRLEPDPAGVVPTTRGRAWEVVSGATGALTVKGSGDEVQLRTGHILQVVCPGGYTYAYSTVANDTLVPAVGDTAVPLVSGGAGAPFAQDDILGTNVCFASGLARAFLIEQFRFLIQTEPSTGRPALFLDNGLDNNGDGGRDQGDFTLVAFDVEDLQLGYILRNDTSVNLPGEGGGAPGVFTPLNAERCSAEITVDLYADLARGPCTLSSPQRQLDPVALRVSLTTRTPGEIRDDNGLVVQDPNHFPGAFSTENHDRSGEPPDGFRRVLRLFTINLDNMDSRGIPLL